MFIYQTLWAALKQLFKKQMNENVSLLKKKPWAAGFIPIVHGRVLYATLQRCLMQIKTHNDNDGKTDESQTL